MELAKYNITRNGIKHVDVRLHVAEDQLRHNPVNKKAQADFLKKWDMKSKLN